MISFLKQSKLKLEQSVALVLGLFIVLFALKNIYIYAITTVCILFFFLVVHKKYFPILLVVLIPCSYLFTIFLFNSGVFEQHQFKVIAFIKIISFLLLPLLIYFIVNIKKIKFTYYDFYSILFLIVVGIYFFLGSFTYAQKISQLQPLLFFIFFVYLGRFFYLNKIRILLLENSYIFISILVIALGIPMYAFADKLVDIGLSPKEYSIISTGMLERQFIGNFNASTYSFLFYDSIGLIKRFFSIFYSGIGLAYFLSYAFLLTFFTKKRKLSIIIFIAIIATLTRGSWLLLVISYLVSLLVLYSNNKIKIIGLILSVIALILFYFKYQNIINIYFESGIVDVFSFSSEDQSAAQHLFSVFILFDLIHNKIFGYGIGYETGESFLVDIFGQMGIIGMSIFILLFYYKLITIKKAFVKSRNKRYFIAGIFILFNLIGSLISRENYTFIVSYFSWIYIGYMYEMARRERKYENIS